MAKKSKNLITLNCAFCELSPLNIHITGKEAACFPENGGGCLYISERLESVGDRKNIKTHDGFKRSTNDGGKVFVSHID